MISERKNLRVRIQRNQHQHLRLQTQSSEFSHVAFKSRDNCRRIIDLDKKLQITLKRYDTEIRQNMPPEMTCQLQLYHLIHKCQTSSIYKVRHLQEGRHYALKKTFIDSRRQNREQKIIRSLKSNFLIEVKDVYFSNKGNKNSIKNKEEQQELNILMKLYQKSLKDLIHSESQIDILEIRSMFYQMTRAVHYIHSRGICHRNIKPSNFLVDQKGRVYLSDFASAKGLKQGECSITEIGSLAYRAPQLLLQDKNYTNSIDIWSLGCTFLQLLTGKQLFYGSSNIDSLLQIGRYLGTSDLKRIKGNESLLKIIPKIKGSGLQGLINEYQASLKDLIDRMLQINSNKRITTIDILSHSFFDDLREEQVYLQAKRQRYDMADFYSFTSAEMKNYQQYYTKLIPIWRRDRPDKRSSNH